RGRTGTHHITYELALPDGTILRTRVSHPPDRTGYGVDMWKHILRDQLEVDEAVFWACVRDRRPPDRGGVTIPGETLPAALVALLIRQVGIPEAEVAKLTREQ